MTSSAVQIFCLIFLSASPPDFYLSKYRKNLACKSSSQIVEEAEKERLSPTLVMALISVESNWNRKAKSHANACGLTQVIPKYTGKITRKYTCEQLWVPRNSIHAGIKILKYWIDYHNGDVARGLCGYNAGYRCSGSKPNKYGMRYARKVLKIKKMLDEAYEKKSKQI